MVKFEGFIDITSKEGEDGVENGVVEPWVITQPQLLVHFGDIRVGTEWWYWKNKYGVKGKDDSVFQGIVKWVFLN